MFKHTCAVVSAAALLTVNPAPIGAQPAPEPTPRRAGPRPSSRTLPNRVFIDVNGGFQSSTRTFTDTRNDPFFGETASWTADYETESGPTFAVAAGIRVWRNLVASVEYSSFTDTSTADIQGEVPHPFFFNRDRQIAGDAVGLKQKEDVIHMSGMWVAPVVSWLDVRLFGGPSLYRIKRDLVANVVYSEIGYPYDSAAFDTTEIERVDDHAWGFHVGGDVTWMFTQALGVGAMAKFSRAATDIASPASGESLGFRFGGLQFGGGIRLRFGRVSPRKEGTKGPDRPELAPPTANPARPAGAAPAPPTDQAPDETRDTTTAKSFVRDTAVLKKDAGVFVRPGVLQPLRVLAAGTRLKVREEAGEWLMVEFKDAQWGTRVGYVLRADCYWP